MKLRISRRILGAVSVTGLALGAFANIQENPYQSIAARNAFGLRPIPPPKPVEVEAVPAAPLPEIKLTGITTLLGAPKALFQYEDKQTKKAEFPFPMAEGETYKSLTVLGIDVENERVLIQNGETQAMVDFANHGVKPTLLDVPNHKPHTVPSISLTGGPVNHTNSRVIVVGGGVHTPSSPARPTASPPMAREEAEALMEITRKKLQAQEQAGQAQQGQPHSQIFPPTRVGEALQQPFAGQPR